MRAGGELVEAARSGTLGRLAAGVVHEVRNPLGVVALGVAFLRKHPAADDPELAEVLADMSDAVARAGAAVAGLLDLATPRDAVTCRRALVEPLHRALALVRMQKCCGGVDIVVDLGADLPEVEVDEVGTTHVLVNVLLDLLDAPPGAESIRIHTFALGALDPGAPGDGAPRRAWVVCEVESVPVRVPRGVPHPAPGHGPWHPLARNPGFTVSRQLVEDHGGWLRVTKGRGGGARVTVAYPAAE
ncbi:MAG: hypothetical protein IPK07_00225 [Deltaproteobacteria bacterium]|nr:hypothetical protein [Deltaproteobacteria bacterium]